MQILSILYYKLVLTNTLESIKTVALITESNDISHSRRVQPSIGIET